MPLINQNGLLVIITGDGKGKTSAATGMAIRALGAGRRVDWVAFDKGPQENADESALYSERAILRQFPNLELYPFGLCRMNANGTFRFSNTDEDRTEAQRAMEKAGQLLQTPQVDLLICDEILSSVGSGLITMKNVSDLVALHKELGKTCDLVLTGRGVNYPELVEAADIVSEIQCVKHRYSKGMTARKGLDF